MMLKHKPVYDVKRSQFAVRMSSEQKARLQILGEQDGQFMGEWVCAQIDRAWELRMGGTVALPMDIEEGPPGDQHGHGVGQPTPV